MLNININEIKIPVPWGYISGKTIGSKENPPVLAVHGLQDNSSTFDRLIKLLPKYYYYVCIDLPSHGKSSHISPHVVYDTLMPLISIKYVINYFNWDRIIYMGHSYGAQIGVYFALLYPNCIEKFIEFDSVTQYSIEPEYFINYIEHIVDKYMLNEEKIKNTKPPTYTYEEALNNVMTKRPTYLKKEAAELLISRMLIEHPNGKYAFSTDQRLKFFVRPVVSTKYLLSVLRKHQFQFPHLIIMASETVKLGLFQQFKNIIKEWKKNKYFEIYEVEGNHDVHNNNPELVSKIVTKFLNKKYSKI